MNQHFTDYPPNGNEPPRWEFVAASAPGSIWNANGRAIYVRFDRDLFYRTCEEQKYLADDGIYIVELGRWVKKEAS